MQRQGEAGLQINQPPCRTRCFQRPLKNWCNPSRTGGLTITIFPSLISLTNLVSLPSHFCTCTNLSPSMEKVDYEQKKKNFFFIFYLGPAEGNHQWSHPQVLLILLWHAGHQAWSHQTPLPSWQRAQCSWRCSEFSPPPCLHPGWSLQLVWWHYPLVSWQSQRLSKKSLKV